TRSRRATRWSCRCRCRRSAAGSPRRGRAPGAARRTHGDATRSCNGTGDRSSARRAAREDQRSARTAHRPCASTARLEFTRDLLGWSRGDEMRLELVTLIMLAWAVMTAGLAILPAMLGNVVGE